MKYPNGPKSDWLRQAEEIISGKIQISQDELPYLLEWLQDYNWPGAKEIAAHLIQYADRLVEAIRDILKSDDYIWIYWVLSLIVVNLPKSLCSRLSDDLKALAYNYDEEGAHVEALRICVQHNLDKTNYLRNIINVKIRIDNDNKDEYIDILSDLDK